MKDMLGEFIDFLDKTGKKSEFELFLKIFQSTPKTKFAVIKISGKTLEDKMDIIAENIAYLNKLGIYPTVVHGAGSILDAKLQSSKKIGGLRVTSKEDMQTVIEVYKDIGERLASKIISYGGSAKTARDILTAEPIEGLGCVGKITGVDSTKIEEIIEHNKTPVVSPIGKYNNTWLNINADTAAKELVKKICPKKLLMITETGGILDENGAIMPFMNLSGDEDLAHITGGMQLKVKEIKDLLETVPDCAVVITSAEDILKELFTISGRGTFIKNHNICTTRDKNEIDMHKLKNLIENSFDKKLVDYYFDEDMTEIIYEINYDGAAIIKTVNSIPYLDKFAVSKACQGTGLGKSIWAEVVARYPKMILRAAKDNPVNSFYIRNCEGMIKKSGWNIYWNNIEEDELFSAIEAVEEKKATLTEHKNEIE